MLEKQRTIKRPVSYSGKGLHTGEMTTITFKPAIGNYGYKFVRTDLKEEVEIPALTENVVDLSRGTTLGIDDVKVHTVEHVLAALVGLQIDNCRIELEGSEPPVGDGSSMPYVETLMAAGSVEQEAKRDYLLVDEAIRYTNEERETDIVALPNDDFRVTVMIDYHNPALGSQHTGLFNLEKEFVTEFAPSRTFCFLTEVEMLHDQGLIKGGDVDSAIVIVDRDMDGSELNSIKDRFGLIKAPVLGSNGILNNAELRYKNEPARHKLLDMLGDLALVGAPIKSQVLAARPGHASNFEFAKKLRQEYLKQKPIKKYKLNNSTGALFNIDVIKKILPHRYPFLLVDKVIGMDLEKKTLIAVKNVTVNEEFFNGHFPDKPVMPGVLMLEAMAQTSGLLLYHLEEAVRDKLLLFMSMNNVKFRNPVIPGDQIVMEVTMTRKRFNTYTYQGTSYVDGKVVAEAELSAAAIERES